MLKSKLIDTKYVDPKGVARTPNVITSITEDEIKEGKFSPEDILPAMAVQVALNNIKPESFPIPYTEDNRTLTFQLGQSDYDDVNIQLGGKILRIGTGEQDGNLKCLFSDDRVDIYNASSSFQTYQYMTANYEKLEFNQTRSGKMLRYTRVGVDNIRVYAHNLTGNNDFSVTVGFDGISLHRYVSNASYTYNLLYTHFATLISIVYNASKNGISDVATSATLSDLISSYNSLLAHLRTSGILKS